MMQVLTDLYSQSKLLDQRLEVLNNSSIDVPMPM